MCETEFAGSEQVSRLQFRISTGDLEQIREAAWLVRKPMATFVRDLAVAEAKRILALPGNNLIEKRNEYLRELAAGNVKANDN